MEFKLWIDGRWVNSEGGGRLAVENPATGEKMAEVIDASAVDVDHAVQAAKRAFYGGRWSQKTPGERSSIMWKLADLLEARAEEFARAETENTGKPYKFLSLGGDIPFSIDNLRFFAGAARDMHGSHAGEFMNGYTSLYRREPVGVVGQITPWNYPLMMAIWKMGPALAAGCTIVLKPSSLTPLTTLMLAEITAEAGIPAGVVNIITGRQAGPALVEHPDIRMIGITGSSDSGKEVMRKAAGTLKRVHLELGGKAPLLVFSDADIELAATKATLGAIMNTGQDCTAATRVYVEEKQSKKMTEALVESMRRVKVGLPFDEGVQMGPLISKNQQEVVSGFVKRAKKTGARLLSGGDVPKEFPRGYYFEPTVMTDVHQKSEIVQSEVFGPIITLQTFRTEGEAVEYGNDVVYGLAASVFTKDISLAMKISAQLEFGTVWINDHMPLTSETPHGGFKQSGFGKDLSAEAVADYQITKHVMIAL